jgi:PIN domain nuclease of toxin-antitoxin system
MPAAVLDAHALLAFFRGEDAATAVKELLHKAASADRPLHMTEVNYAEV